MLRMIRHPLALGLLLLGAWGVRAAEQPPAPQPTSAAPCFDCLYDYLMASPEECPLAWNGVTLFATIDVGVTHDSHGFRSTAPIPTASKRSFRKTATAR